ncbi:hypothetical protein AALO_G00011880 [Alosa alosa]|uniref:Uncharacterized protein n=1 Tax=Alosa alosa TaxID=278164 RepID=A0AAV6HJR0_9TELE|nr:hypothetical protein AALO_G00011880 [Alosa alosa]
MEMGTLVGNTVSVERFCAHRSPLDSDWSRSPHIRRTAAGQSYHVDLYVTQGSTSCQDKKWRGGVLISSEV